MLSVCAVQWSVGCQIDSVKSACRILMLISLDIEVVPVTVMNGRSNRWEKTHRKAKNKKKKKRFSNISFIKNTE